MGVLRAHAQHTGQYKHLCDKATQLHLAADCTFEGFTAFSGAAVSLGAGTLGTFHRCSFARNAAAGESDRARLRPHGAAIALQQGVQRGERLCASAWTDSCEFRGSESDAPPASAARSACKLFSSNAQEPRVYALHSRKQTKPWALQESDKVDENRAIAQFDWATPRDGALQRLVRVRACLLGTIVRLCEMPYRQVRSKVA